MGAIKIIGNPVCIIIFLILPFLIISCSKTNPEQKETSHTSKVQDEKQKIYPVRWTKEVDLKSIDDIEKKLDEPVWVGSDRDKLEMTNPDDETIKVTVKTSREYLDLKAKGYYAYSTYDLSMESWFKDKANTLVFLKNARPANKSFIENYKITDDPLKNIPANLGLFLCSGDEERRVEDAMVKGQTWKEIYKGSVVSVKNKERIVIKDECQLADISEIARGDFNGDGVEDILLFIAYHILEGSGRSYRHYMLTRLSEDGTLVATEKKVNEK